ncbi:TraB/GumN family protein [Candidatus Methanoperedens nitratireducens]|uniref:Pheromone shutdown-related protein TraB n=1 Tax=Candidatus Methanoperedens nitratireducens TaxID=1392998 RepID=A0A284VLF8_9EURY|nr:TraB/GumN family protein [Candidatus Methanoperedens nitroreducens]SNQ60082.1 Pheromone shutdown-related protein TraB [Candidatus Methanoperedens nitroreducens]
MNKGSYAASCNFNYRNPGLSSGSRVILIGTAHVSEKSVAEVNDVIDREKPDIVAVELCKGRYKALKGEDEVKEINIKEMLSGGKFYYFLLHWLLAYVQKKIGSDTGVKPGAEMLSAIDKAEKSGACVALIDRDIQVTLGRFWNKMSILEKLRLFGSLVAATLGFGTKDIDMDTVTQEDVVTQLVSELRKVAPSAASVLLDERDIFMAKNLVDLSREGKVVAVVGAGHREGIQRYLNAPETIPAVEGLDTVPKKRFSWFKVATVAIIAMVVGLIALLLFQDKISSTVLLTALMYLFIVQGILSAAGVLIARGHPLSALTAFSLAWFGFLHPFLAVGWLAGIVEAHFRPPTTNDLKTIMKAETMKELMQNKLFRLILVAGLANLGSMVGTFVAIPIMVDYLNIPNPLEILKTALDTGFNMLKGLL